MLIRRGSRPECRLRVGRNGWPKSRGLMQPACRSAPALGDGDLFHAHHRVHGTLRCRLIRSGDGDEERAWDNLPGHARGKPLPRIAYLRMRLLLCRDAKTPPPRLAYSPGVRDPLDD